MAISKEGGEEEVKKGFMKVKSYTKLYPVLRTLRNCKISPSFVKYMTRRKRKPKRYITSYTLNDHMDN